MGPPIQFFISQSVLYTLWINPLWSKGPITKVHYIAFTASILPCKTPQMAPAMLQGCHTPSKVSPLPAWRSRMLGWTLLPLKVCTALPCSMLHEAVLPTISSLIRRGMYCPIPQHAALCEALGTSALGEAHLLPLSDHLNLNCNLSHMRCIWGTYTIPPPTLHVTNMA